MENKRKLPYSSKCGYGLGSVVLAAKETAFSTFLMFYYTQVLGLSGTLSGMALLIGLIIDAITDPVMGSISDNLHSRFGRRHPFIACSAIPLSISIYLLFSPPSGMSQKGLFIWLTSFVVFARFMLTIFQVPYLALGAELTEDYVERTTISTYRITFGYFSAVSIMAAAFLLFFPETGKYGLGQMNAAGYPSLGLFCALIMLVMSAGFLSLTRKEIPFLPGPSANQLPLSVNRLLKELKLALTNQSFRIVFITSLFAGTIHGIYVNLGLHVNTYFWALNSKDLAMISTSVLLAAIIAFSLMKWIQNFEKKKAYIATVILSSLGSGLVLLRLFDILPPNGSPLLFNIIYINAVYIYTLVIIAAILVGSIIADTVDEGELITGVRQEGMYFAFLSFSSKAFTGLGSLFAGLIIDFIGLPAKISPVAVSPKVIWKLGVFVGPVQGLLWFIPFLIIIRLNISRERMNEIRRQLNERKKITNIP